MNEHKIQQLTRLGALRDSGALTDDEFKAQKTLILGAGKPSIKPSVSEIQLRRIESLRQSGALSDEEAAEEKAKVLRSDSAPPPPMPTETLAATADLSIGPLVPAWAARRRKTGVSPMAAVIVLFMLIAIGGGGWWFATRTSGGEDSYVVTGVANVRTAPTTEFSSVVKTLSAGDRVQGRWVAGRNGSRWLEISGDRDSYIWEGNLRIQ